MKSKSKKNPTACYCLKIRRASGAVTSFYDRILEPSGVSVGQYSILLNISKAEKGTLKELSDMAELDRSTLARNVKPLFAKLLVCDTKEYGARDSQLKLTDTGQETLVYAAKLWDEAQERVRSSLGKDVIAQLEETLKALETL